MDERKVSQMRVYLSTRQDACAAKQASLLQEGRKDEAIFEVIRSNVFQLSRSVLDAAAKQKEGEAFFRQRMQQIPANWQAAKDRALTYDDTVQTHLEALKLEAAEEVRQAFEKIWSDEP